MGAANRPTDANSILQVEGDGLLTQCQHSKEGNGVEEEKHLEHAHNGQSRGWGLQKQGEKHNQDNHQVSQDMTSGWTRQKPGLGAIEERVPTFAQEKSEKQNISNTCQQLDDCPLAKRGLVLVSPFSGGSSWPQQKGVLFTFLTALSQGPTKSIPLFLSTMPSPCQKLLDWSQTSVQRPLVPTGNTGQQLHLFLVFVVCYPVVVLILSNHFQHRMIALSLVYKKYNTKYYKILKISRETKEMRVKGTSPWKKSFHKEQGSIVRTKKGPL